MRLSNVIRLKGKTYMREYIRYSLVLLGFGLFFAGCEVGITPLEKSFNEAGVATSAEVTEDGDIGTITIDIQEGVDREELNVSIKLTGEGSQYFTAKMDKTAAGYIGEITVKDWVKVPKDTPYTFYAQTIVNGYPMCKRKVRKTIYKNVAEDTPVITLIGASYIKLTTKSTYTEQGATAIDDVDGNISSDINRTITFVAPNTLTVETVAKNMKPLLLGRYTITYSVTNKAGKTATEKRTVNVGISRKTLVGLLLDFDSNSKEIESADTSGIVSMNKLFKDKGSFNLDISRWDVSSVTSMEYMFYGATDFNSSLKDWNVSNVKSMLDIFAYATAFNQPIGNWDTSSVTNMQNMFWEATAFNQPIGEWNTSSVKNMLGMFSEARNFNQDLHSWDVHKVTNMQSMFRTATAFNGSIGAWDTSSVIKMGFMFKDAISFDQNISKWDVLNVTGHVDFDTNSSLTKENKPPFL